MLLSCEKEALLTNRKQRRKKLREYIHEGHTKAESEIYIKQLEKYYQMKHEEQNREITNDICKIFKDAYIRQRAEYYQINDTL